MTRCWKNKWQIPVALKQKEYVDAIKEYVEVINNYIWNEKMQSFFSHETVFSNATQLHQY